MTRIVMMGPPGVGKGTQAVRLAAALGVPSISTGDLFRAEVDNRTPLGLELESTISSGNYVPDDVTNQLVTERLSAPDVVDGFILDGYPRTILQVAELDRILGSQLRRLDWCILLTADADHLVRRIIGRSAVQERGDDDPEVIRHRIRVYEAETAPLAETYDERGILIRVDAGGPIDAISAQILNSLTTAGRLEE